MAHALRLSELTEELIEVITGYNPTNSARVFRACKDASAKALKSHRYGRTNQYSVKSSLNGLVEKFQVLNNDPLADALVKRLEALDRQQYKWAPEVLSLLLNLSDRPLEKAIVENAEPRSEPDPAPQLTWKEIIADDPLEADGLWDDIDYAANSSEDDDTLDSLLVSEETGNTALSAQTDTDLHFNVESVLVKPDFTALDDVIKSQYWTGTSGRAVSGLYLRGRLLITEIQSIRDVLNMISGLPSNMFVFEDLFVVSRKKHIITNVSDSVFDDVMQSFADTGTDLSHLRNWCNGLQSIPLLQSFQAATIKRIHEFDTYIVDLQKQFTMSTQSVLASLLSVQVSVQAKARMTAQLWELIQGVRRRLDTQPFVILDTLLEQSCDTQAAGDAEAFEFFGKLFLDCLQVYLKPIRTWMEAGHLDFNDSHFPILIRDEGADSADFWKDRYALRIAGTDLHAPKFLRSSMAEVLASGKSVAFLKELGLENELLNGSATEKPCLMFDDIFPTNAGVTLASFSDSFQRALDNWILSKHRHFAGILKNCLLHDFGLDRTIQALDCIFLSTNGAIFDLFSRWIFNRLQSSRSSWNNRSILGTAAQTIFRDADSVDASNVTAMFSTLGKTNGKPDRTVKALSAVTLYYKCSWPVQNIVPTASRKTYQKLFTIILQIRRARHALTQPRLLFSNQSVRHLTSSKSNLNLALLLRHRILHLVTTVESHVLNHAVASSRSELQTALSNASDIDAMVAAHKAFIDSLESRAFLTESLSSVHKALLSCLDLAVLFAEVRGSDERQSDRKTKSSADDSKVEWASSSPAFDESVADQKNPSALSDEDKALKYRQMQRQLDQLISFITSGLRAAGRKGGGEEGWEILAENLQSGSTIIADGLS